MKDCRPACVILMRPENAPGGSVAFPAVSVAPPSARAAMRCRLAANCSWLSHVIVGLPGTVMLPVRNCAAPAPLGVRRLGLR